MRIRLLVLLLAVTEIAGACAEAKAPPVDASATGGDGDGDGDGDVNGPVLTFNYTAIDPPTTIEFVEPIALSNEGHVLLNGHGPDETFSIPFVWRGEGDIEEIAIPDGYMYLWQDLTKPACLWTGDRVVLTLTITDGYKHQPALLDGSSMMEIVVDDAGSQVVVAHCNEQGGYVIGRSIIVMDDAWRWHAGQTIRDGDVGGPLGVNRHGVVCTTDGCYTDDAFEPWPDWHVGVFSGPSADGFVAGLAEDEAQPARWQIGSETFEVIDPPRQGGDDSYKPILIAPNGDVIIDDEDGEPRFYLYRDGTSSPLVAGDLEITEVVAFNDEGEILVRTTDFAAILRAE